MPCHLQNASEMNEIIGSSSSLASFFPLISSLGYFLGLTVCSGELYPLFCGPLTRLHRRRFLHRATRVGLRPNARIGPFCVTTLATLKILTARVPHPRLVRSSRRTRASLMIASSSSFAPFRPTTRPIPFSVLTIERFVLLFKRWEASGEPWVSRIYHFDIDACRLFFRLDFHIEIRIPICRMHLKRASGTPRRAKGH